MFSKKILTDKGKELAFLLRHDKDAYNDGKIDNNGWRECNELYTLGYTKELIDEIVSTNEKKRYEYNKDHTKIRARQGHSIPVDVELKECKPIQMLCHGTSVEFIESIKKEGLKKMSRQHVHLSDNVDTAKQVGKRHAHDNKIAIIIIDAVKMWYDGIKFYKSNNGVWLTDYVDPKYFIKIDTV